MKCEWSRKGIASDSFEWWKMAKYLKEFDLYDETDPTRDLKVQQRLTTESRCVLANFEKQFSKFKYRNSQNAWKIGVNVVKSITRQNPIVIGGCIEVQIVFDLEHYFDAKNFDKKKMILEMLWNGILVSVEAFKWGISPFEDAKKAVIESNYTYHWSWKKPKPSPSKHYKAEIFCEHEIECFGIYLVIRGPNNSILKKIHLIDEEPSEFVFAKYFGSLEWISDDSVVFASKDESIGWTYNTKKDFLKKCCR